MGVIFHVQAMQQWFLQVVHTVTVYMSPARFVGVLALQLLISSLQAKGFLMVIGQDFTQTCLVMLPAPSMPV